MSQPKYLEEALKKIKWERGNLLLAFDEAAQIVPNQIEFIKAQKNLLLELDSEFESNNPVTIAFLGQTGHGKSTLANAIIGYEVLPSSGSKVCTAGVTRVRHADIEGFKATITYLTEEAFRQELEFVKITLGMQNPHQVGDEPTQNADEFGDIKIPETTEIRLRAIFGKEVFEKFVNSFGLSEPSFPPSIKRVLEMKREFIKSESVKDFRNQLQNYLVVPKQQDADSEIGSIWPLVQEVLVEGRFDSLATGAEIVDLPGLNDPNPAREAVTIEYLKNAKFVAIIFGFTRGIGKDIRSALEERDLLRNLLIAGRANAITFVSTKCDSHNLNDQDRPEIIENPSMNDSELLHLINENYKKNEFPQLRQELANQLIETSTDDKELIKLRELFNESPIFMTSPLQFLNHEKLAKGEKPRDVKFENRSQTGIPDLRRHFEILSNDAGPKMLVERIRNKVIGPAQAVVVTLSSELAQIDLSDSALLSAFEELIAYLSESSKRIDETFEQYLFQHKEYLQQQARSFINTISASPLGVQKIQKDFEGYLLQITNWRTLKAVMQHGGVFSSSGPMGLINLKDQIKKPISDFTFAPWIRFFQGALNESIESTRNHFLLYLNDYQIRAKEKFPKSDQYTNEIDALELELEDISLRIDTDMKNVQSSLERRISQTQASLDNIIKSNIDSELNPLIVQASLESGPGMMNRIRAILNNGSKKVIDDLFTLTREKILEEVNQALFDINTILRNSANLVIEEVNKFAGKFEVDEARPKRNDNDALITLRDKLLQSIDNINRVNVYSDWDSISNFPPPDLEKTYMIMDGSNLSTSSTQIGKRTKISVLLECRKALAEKFPGVEIITLVDSNYYKFLETEREKERLSSLEAQGIVLVIANRDWKGNDRYLLSMAQDYRATVVCKSDAYKQHENEFPFIRESKRRLTALRVEEGNWYFKFERE